MHQIPSVSVVIPLYNKEATIGRSIKSILQQSFQDCEIVLVDDGSTDNSKSVSTGFNDPRIALYSQANAGPGAARNAGVAHARGDFIAFLDADDEWLPDHLASAVSALQAEPDCAAYLCGYDSGSFRKHRPNKILQLGKPKGPASPPIDSEGIDLKRHVDAMHSSCVVVRKDVFAALGGFFGEDGCRYGEDSWFYARLLFGHRIFWNPEEHTQFHVEDSDLGFAVRKRTSARPISLYPDRLQDGLAPDARDALRRLSRVFAKADYDMLMASGAWDAAGRLRRQHHLGGAVGALKEQVRKVKHIAKRMLGRSPRPS
jgi:glycosyltransferase involved in cell wall biosynthesis